MLPSPREATCRVGRVFSTRPSQDVINHEIIIRFLFSSLLKQRSVRVGRLYYRLPSQKSGACATLTYERGVVPFSTPDD